MNVMTEYEEALDPSEWNDGPVTKIEGEALRCLATREAQLKVLLTKVRAERLLLADKLLCVRLVPVAEIERYSRLLQIDHKIQQRLGG